MPEIFSLQQELREANDWENYWIIGLLVWKMSEVINRLSIYFLSNLAYNTFFIAELFLLWIPGQAEL